MVHKLSDEDWSVVLASHLSVAVELTTAMAPGLRRHGYGRIVYMGSAAGLVGSIGQANYAVAKAGLWGLTRAVALEMAGRDVCVNYLIPFGWTRMTESIPPANGQLRAYLRDAPRSKPDHIAPVVAWLCSKAAAGISGQIVGARGAELTVWSQPRPALRLVDTSGWDAAALDAARPQIDDHLLSLQSQFDLFGGPPIPVEDAHQSDPSFDAGDPTNPS
jgi:NAD(P)-dependent dehydrogenase (short-subunit alcohol dehydrogenase family)